MIHSIRTVRVGVLVEREDCKIIPFRYSMFHCRSRDRGDEKHFPLSDWAAEEVNLLSVRAGLPGQNKIPVGGSARFWVHMRMTHTSDYWGEHDTDVDILKCRRIK
jgi:hypothetical protein